MDVSDAKRLKASEVENTKLKKLLAETMLDNAVLKDINSKKVVAPTAKHAAVDHACAEHGLSQRRACQLLGADRSMVRYRPLECGDDAILKGV